MASFPYNYFFLRAEEEFCCGSNHSENSGVHSVFS